MTEWIWEFMGTIGEPVSKEQAVKTGEAFIKAERLFLWEVNGKYVSIANATRPTTHNITINFVYTPREERKRLCLKLCVHAFSAYARQRFSNNKSIHGHDKPYA